MKRCPITYEPIESGFYSKKGLAYLNPRLKQLDPFPFDINEQLQEARRRMTKMSIQGVQPKMSAILSVAKSVFEPVDRNGIFILKPAISTYPEVPRNEDLTMRLAKACGIDVPLHGLIYAKDNSMVYFIRRFDRVGKKGRIHIEDFAQLAGKSRETKYNYSMERVAKLIETYCTYPAVDKIKLFRRTLFSFLTGNEDMHLKNFSVIHDKQRISLSPAYDMLNTWLVLSNPIVELALSLKGKKSNFTYNHFFTYYGKERLGITDKVLDRLKTEFRIAYSEKWPPIIQNSFLSDELKEKYVEIVDERFQRIFG